MFSFHATADDVKLDVIWGYTRDAISTMMSLTIVVFFSRSALLMHNTDGDYTVDDEIWMGYLNREMGLKIVVCERTVSKNIPSILQDENKKWIEGIHKKKNPIQHLLASLSSLPTWNERRNLAALALILMGWKERVFCNSCWWKYFPFFSFTSFEQHSQGSKMNWQQQ